MSTAQEIVHLFEKQLGEGSQQPAERPIFAAVPLSIQGIPP